VSRFLTAYQPTRLHSAIHAGSWWKIQDKDELKTQTIHKWSITEEKAIKANNTKHSKTKLPWFSRLLQHSARKWGRLILRYQAHMGLL